MGILNTLLLVVFALCAVLLIVLVMMQDDQGEGLGGIFGGGSSTPFGSSSGNVLTKITGILGVVFIVCSLGLAYVTKSGDSDDVLGEARRGNSTERWYDEEAKVEDEESSDE